MVGQTPLDRQAPGAGPQPLVDLAAERHRPLPRARPDPLAEGRPQPGRVPQADPGRAARARGRRDGARLADRLRLPPAGRVPEEHRLLGRHPRGDPAGAAGGLFLGRVRPARERCRSTPAAWACWPATTSRAPATWACRWSASACSTTRATSARPRRRRLAAGALPRRRRRHAADRAGARRRRPAADGRDRHARPARSQARVWRIEVGRVDAATCSTPTCRENTARTAS